jgi:hypothetical protein
MSFREGIAAHRENKVAERNGARLHRFCHLLGLIGLMKAERFRFEKIGRFRSGQSQCHLVVQGQEAREGGLLLYRITK